MANNNPNTGPLLKSIEDKKHKTKLKVENTIKDMIRQKIKINFNSVSDRSGVSKSFLYKYDDIKTRIESLRKQDDYLDKPNKAKRKMSDESKDVIIASLRKRNKQLEEENKQLKEQLKVEWAAIYNNIE
jgi:hypothetical protein